MAEIFEKKTFFKHWTIWGPPLKIKISITFFVCLGLKRAEKTFGGYKKK